MMVRVTRLTKQFSRPVNVWGKTLYNTILSGQKKTDISLILILTMTMEVIIYLSGLYDDDGNDVLEQDDDDDNNDRPHLGTGLAHLRQTQGCLRPGHLPPKYGSEQS